MCQDHKFQLVFTPSVIEKANRKPTQISHLFKDIVLKRLYYIWHYNDFVPHSTVLSLLPTFLVGGMRLLRLLASVLSTI